ncbi:phosphate ABC transporter membrane protein 1, PhoT family [Thalassoporum mexicanum PCC 7367]|uniref:phosphate ABC transporter permease subunit PstC n=1 Tax=Thalassoporum mexicanum TaxID=3457544 RepID=UPI00029FE442|nr:phosphate ABC transporter permease subunit PstC [Pseudanabaena sp. PCC 7367]AFY69688.1 phosphate ABC transporter membrane protein 1, PhoT family [Pseudanabaena sp. PCC 7367]
MAIASAAPRNIDPENLKKRSNRNLPERIVTVILFTCASISVFTTIFIVVILASETIQFFSQPIVSLGEYLFGATNSAGEYTCSWTPQFSGAQKHFCIWPTIAGTFLVSVIAMFVAIPIGLATSAYLSEYATPKVGKILRPLVELLAGVPTVVYGYFALLFITPILRAVIPGAQQFNALSAGLVMGFMIVPTVASISTDAMRSVPQALRDAAYGIGATKQEVTTKVVFPAALSGIAAAIILGISRAVGETMIVSIAAGQKPTLTLNPLETIGTMTAYITQVTKGDARVGSVEYQALFAVGMTLFLITLGLNLISKVVSSRLQEKYD